jgi:hypothetical protein
MTTLAVDEDGGNDCVVMTSGDGMSKIPINKTEIRDKHDLISSYSVLSFGQVQHRDGQNLPLLALYGHTLSNPSDVLATMFDIIDLPILSSRLLWPNRTFLKCFGVKSLAGLQVCREAGCGQSRSGSASHRNDVHDF